MKEAKITFCSGAGSVTGANFLFEIEGKKILIDCGLVQGEEIADEINWDSFTYDPSEIDILFVTHAHLDHIGRIPKLVNDGFKGKIFSTKPTRDLALPMLLDTAGILSKNRKFDLEQIYSEENIGNSFSNWNGFEYHEEIKISDELTFTFWDAGHILGSAMIEFKYNGKKIVFTGDLGNSPSPLLPDTEKIENVDYLIMESVYGDRNHESREDRRGMLEKIIKENYERKGTLIIPVFSLERSQELLFELNNLVGENKIPIMPIFFDSPLAIKLTEIFKRYQNYFNETAKKALSTDEYLFDFPGLHSTLRSEESRKINEVLPPKIIIAGSGMSSGGRIVHHEIYYLPHKDNTILLTGYQAVGTMGRMIEEGVKTVKINGEQVSVKAHVANILGYSGHKDGEHLLKFVEDMKGDLKKVFVVMGESKSSMFLAQRIKDNLDIEAVVPTKGDSILITL